MGPDERSCRCGGVGLTVLSSYPFSPPWHVEAADEMPGPHVEAVGEAPADEVAGRCAVEEGGKFVRDAVWSRFPHGARAGRWS
jgi:hypothetical protein